MIKYIQLSFIAFLFTITACVDTDFDTPPTDGENEITEQPGISISGLKELADDNSIIQIQTDLTIKGQIVADDRSGNFFREFILQDETGGIAILINLTSAYTLFPVGREILIDCQGLYLGVDNGVIKLGGYVINEGGGETLGNIVDYNERITRGKLKDPIEPAVKSIADLKDSDISSLVRIDNVEFASQELGLTYADPIGRSSINRTLVDCNGREIILRSSGFADFAGDELPSGNGSIVAIYSVFRDDRQLFIRNREDVQFTGDRCSGGSVSTGSETPITIQEVRDLFISGTATAPNDRKILGTVISDKDSGNWDGRNLVIQDETAGIVVRFADDHNFALNEEIEVVISGQELSEFSGLLQVNAVPNNFANRMGAGTAPEPKVATVAEIIGNAENWESTLVTIRQASITGNSTYQGSTTVSDATGSIAMFTRNDATFSTSPVPAGTVDMTVIVSQFDDPQVLIRNLDDVQGEGPIDGGEVNQISIKEIRDLFTAGSSAVPTNRKIKGVVISDATTGNLNGQNVVIQDETAGIVVRFTDDHPLQLGEEVEVVVSGQELSEFNGLLQINNVPVSNATVLGVGSLPAPRVAKIMEIINNLEAWESTLVEVQEVTISGEEGTYQGSTTVSDATGSIAMFTRNDASFASAALPAGPVTITAIVSQFEDPQLALRNIDDIE